MEFFFSDFHSKFLILLFSVTSMVCNTLLLLRLALIVNLRCR